MDEQVKIGGSKKKWWVLGIILVIVLFGLFLLKGPENKETIRIGAVLPFTGKIAPIAEQIKNGITLAVDNLNSQNDRKVEVIYEDSMLDAKTGISAVNKLIDTDGIKYLHIAASPIISAVQPITEKRGIVMVAVSQAPSILKGTNYMLRIYFNLDQAMDKFVEYINAGKYQKVAVLYQNTAVLQDQINYLENKGLVFTDKEKYNLDEKDFKTVLLKIKVAKPDLLILMGYGAGFPTIFNQMNDLGLNNVPVLGTADFLGVPKDSYNLFGNVTFLVPAFYLGQTDMMKKFISDYTNKFGISPDDQAAYAYDTTHLLYKGISQTDGSAQRVVEFLKNYGDYDGVAGRITLKGGDARSDLSFAKYMDGKLVPNK